MAVPERAALSRELADFLIELSIALHKHAMYPEGHPSLGPAAGALTHRAENLLEHRATLSLGVARQQLVIEGVATDPKHPVLAELAGRLHRHHLGALTFHRGVRAAEITDVLRTLAAEADRTGEPLGLGPADRLRAWPNVRLHPLTYERLELVDEDPTLGEPRGTAAAARSAQLWVGIARAALAAEAAESGEGDSTPPLEPAVVAQAIDQHPKSAAYDQVIVGYLLQIADELKATGGAEAAALRRRTSKLIGALQPATLRRLIEMGGDTAQRTQFAIDATHGLAVDAVLEIVRAMADASHRTVSEPLVRMLSKLARHAEQGTAKARVQADGALREQVRRLLAGWSLADPNPEAYGRALHRLAGGGVAPTGGGAVGGGAGAEPERVLQTALELHVGVLGPAVEHAVGRMFADNRLGALVDVLEGAPPGHDRPLADALWARLTAADAVGRLLVEPAPDFATLDRILPRLPAESFAPLLDALATSESRTVRRALLDRLTHAPADVGPVVAARLATDAPWYVIRNLLVVLDGLPGLPEGFSTERFASHSDARVRRAVLSLALKVPAERERTLLAALQDSEPRITQLGLTAALDGCPPAAVPTVVRIARDERRAVELRVLAIRALGRARTPHAFAALLALTDGGKTFLGRRKLPAKSLVLVAALLALATWWGDDPRARAALALAAASKDADIRNATDPGAALP